MLDAHAFPGGPRRTRGRTLLPLAVGPTLLLVLLLTLTVAAATRPAAASPAPLDPLSASEIQTAASVALADPGVMSLLGSGRIYVGSVEFVTMAKGAPDHDDPNQLLNIGRNAMVLACNDDTYAGARAVVDLNAGRTTQSAGVSCDEVPMDYGELQAAWALAQGNASVQALLSPNTSQYQVQPDPTAPPPSYLVEGLRVRASEGSSLCQGHRCFELQFSDPSDGYIAGNQVLVDLTSQTVTVTQPPPPPSGPAMEHSEPARRAARAAKAPRRTRT
jgi:hypothetical protein